MSLQVKLKVRPDYLSVVMLLADGVILATDFSITRWSSGSYILRYRIDAFDAVWTQKLWDTNWALFQVVFLVLIAFPLFRFMQWTVQRLLWHSRLSKAYCSRCRYDLRSSPLYCPECGTSSTDALQAPRLFGLTRKELDRLASACFLMIGVGVTANILGFNRFHLPPELSR